MRFPCLALCLVATLWCSTPATYAQPSEPRLAPGFSLGIAYTPDDDLTGVGWNAAGTLERLVGEVCELRGTLGFVALQGDGQGQDPKATYAFLIADVLAADVVSPTGGVGLYYVDLGAPLVDEDQRSFQFGLNAGVRLMIPNSNHRGRAFTVDGRVHTVFGDGPSLLFTLAAGLVF